MRPNSESRASGDILDGQSPFGLDVSEDMRPFAISVDSRDGKRSSCLETSNIRYLSRSFAVIGIVALVFRKPCRCCPENLRKRTQFES